MHIHIEHLHSNLIESDVLRLFTKYGEVSSVILVRDKLNNRSLGRAFIEMPVRKEGEQAVISLNRIDLNGKRINVSEVLYDPAPNASWSYSQDV